MEDLCSRVLALRWGSEHSSTKQRKQGKYWESKLNSAPVKGQKKGKLGKLAQKEQRKNQELSQKNQSNTVSTELQLVSSAPKSCFEVMFGENPRGSL